MELVYFTVIAIGMYFTADAILTWIERKRGAPFEHRQVVFLAIIMPLALLTFWLVRVLSGDP